MPWIEDTLTIDPARPGSMRRTATAVPYMTPSWSTRRPRSISSGVDLVRAALDVDAGVVDPAPQGRRALGGVGGLLVRLPVADVAVQRLEPGAELGARRFQRLRVPVDADDVVAVREQLRGDRPAGAHRRSRHHARCHLLVRLRRSASRRRRPRGRRGRLPALPRPRRAPPRRRRRRRGGAPRRRPRRGRRGAGGRRAGRSGRRTARAAPRGTYRASSWAAWPWPRSVSASTLAGPRRPRADSTASRDGLVRQERVGAVDARAGDRPAAPDALGDVRVDHLAARSASSTRTGCSGGRTRPGRCRTPARLSPSWTSPDAERAVAEEGQRDSRLAPALERERGADGDRDEVAEHRDEREDAQLGLAEVHVPVAPARRARALAEEVAEAHRRP